MPKSQWDPGPGTGKFLLVLIEMDFEITLETVLQVLGPQRTMSMKVTYKIIWILKVTDRETQARSAMLSLTVREKHFRCVSLF